MEFDDKETDEFAWMIGQKVKKGIINAGSIGFKPTTVEFVEEPKDSTRLIHRKWELMEFSICNVPANTNAMAVRAEEPDMDSEKLTALEAKVAELEAKIQVINTPVEKKSYITELFKDKGEPSPENDKDDATIDTLFVASESSGQKETDKMFESMFAK